MNYPPGSTYDSTHFERLIFIALAAAAFAAVLLVSPVSAAGQEPTTEESDQVFELNAPEILSYQLEGDEPLAVAQAETFVANDARNGILTDLESVNVAAIPDPFTDGNTIDLVWHNGTTPDGLFMARADGADGDAGGSTGAGFTISQIEEGTDSSLIVGGNGYGDATDASGAYLFDGRCAGLQFTPIYPRTSSSKFTMNSCWQKWAKSGTEYWIYNRHTQFTTLNPNNNDEKVTTAAVTKFVDFTIRSQPSRAVGDNNGNLEEFIDWAPSNAEVNCQQGTSFTIGVAGSSVSVPISQCDGLEPIAFVVPQQFGLDYDGSSQQNSMRLDAAGAYAADNSDVIPFWADYNWVELQECVLNGGCTSKIHSQWDGGWQN